MRILRFIPIILYSFLLPGIIHSQSKLIREGEAPEQATMKKLDIRLIDSATGYAVKAKKVSIRSARLQGLPVQESALPLGEGGRFVLGLGSGDHTITVHAQGYQDMALDVSAEDSSTLPINIFLVPLEGPRELESEFLRSLHRPDATLVVGFVVDDQKGEPLANVEVSSAPSGERTTTDNRGFFSFYLPLDSTETSSGGFATLMFQAPGYRTQRRQNVEVWSNGDWIYRIRLQPGAGTETIDEERYRRPHLLKELATETANMESLAVPFPSLEEEESEISKASPAVAIPRNIRVGHSTGVDYRQLDEYCKYVLPAEWIPSWGNLAGGLGMNSLRAGAVAVRTYAIGFIRNPYATNYDICGTTTCQAYDPSRASSLTNDAVNQVANTVMLNSSGAITFKLTEYSSENNALGLSCGDGYRGNSPNCFPDPVCAGTTRNGHGRGMCQYGSARWASGLFLSTLSPHPYGTKTWQGILSHYYPDLQIAVGQPLTIGDAVKVFGTGGIALRVRECSGGGIGSGTACPQTGSRSEGQTGVIVDGPQRILSDGGGYTWWKIAWDGDGLVGWSVENWLERGNPPSDTTAPSTSISSGPSGTINIRDVSFTYTGSDNVTPTGSLQYAYRLEPVESSFSSFGSQTSRSYSNLANGSYTFYVKAKDQAGNQDATPATRSFTVQVSTPDTTPPDTTITGGPSGTINTRDVTFTYTGSDNVTPTGNLQYAYRLDPIESSFSAFSSQTSRSYSGLANGNYTFYIKALDQAGNQDATPANRSFSVQVSTSDTTSPDTTITGGPSGTINTRDVTFTYTGSDNVTPTGSLQYAYRLDPIEGGFSAFSSQTSRSYSGLANGNYTFYVKAMDQAGNQDSTPATRTFTVSITSGGQKATPSDLDGDGLSDWVVYRNGTWVYFGPCTHPLNLPGAAVNPACSSCAGEVCAADSFCCNTEWDEICVDEFYEICR